MITTDKVTEIFCILDESYMNSLRTSSTKASISFMGSNQT